MAASDLNIIQINLRYSKSGSAEKHSCDARRHLTYSQTLDKQGYSYGIRVGRHLLLHSLQGA